jgi:hypothetical protein
MPSVGWSGVKLAAIGLWSSRNVFPGVTKTSFTIWRLYLARKKSGFCGRKENATCTNA